MIREGKINVYNTPQQGNLDLGFRFSESSHGSVLVRDTSKLFISDNPTYIMWWGKFMTCMHNRMGDGMISNLAISLEVMGTMLSFTELYYSKAVRKGEK